MKDAYYFSHDANAKDDPKCVVLIDELGMEGYGIYWMLVETLRSEADFKCPLRMLNGLARRYNTSVEKVKSVVTRYDLFDQDDEWFWSESLMRRMEVYQERKQKLREAGRKGGIAKASVKHRQSDGIASVNHRHSDDVASPEHRHSDDVASPEHRQSHAIASPEHRHSNPLALKESKGKESKVKESESVEKEVARDHWKVEDNEAVKVYIEVFHKPLRPFQRDLIAHHVKENIAAWRNTCEFWREEDYKAGNVEDMIKRYKRSLEVDDSNGKDASNLSQAVRHRLEQMKRDRNISDDAVKKVLSGELTIKLNPQGFPYLTKTTA